MTISNVNNASDIIDLVSSGSKRWPEIMAHAHSEKGTCAFCGATQASDQGNRRFHDFHIPGTKDMFLLYCIGCHNRMFGKGHK